MASEEKAKELAELLAFAKENYPAIAPMVEGRLNHILKRYAGIAVLVGAACELVQVVLG